MAKIGFIGMGNMAGAIMKGSLKTFAPEDIIFFDASAAQAEKVTAETGVAHDCSGSETAGSPGSYGRDQRTCERGSGCDLYRSRFCDR